MRHDTMDHEDRSARSEREDTFQMAYGSKHGSDRHLQRRARKGFKT